MTTLDIIQIVFISLVAAFGLGGVIKVLFFSDSKK